MNINGWHTALGIAAFAAVPANPGAAAQTPGYGLRGFKFIANDLIPDAGRTASDQQ
jgi:hypothetical protein